jgi:hypothetical protein
LDRNKFFAVLCTLLISTAILQGCADKQPAPSKDVSFSGKFVMEYGPGPGESDTHIIHFTRPMQRLEMTSPGGGVTIVREDLGIVWSVMPDKKMFIELPIRPENKNPLFHEPDHVLKYELVGKDTVDGHPVLKEHMVMRNEGDDTERDFYRWFATDIGWPIRAESVDGKWKLYFTDLVPGPQDPNLFEIPMDYNMIMSRKPHTPAPAKP